MGLVGLAYCNYRAKSLQTIILALLPLLLLVPVAGATYLFGQRGGLVTLIYAVLTMLSRVPTEAPGRVNALLEIIAISLVGYMVVLILACLRRNLSRLRVINAVSTALSEAPKLDQVLRGTLDMLMDVLNAEVGAV